MYSFKTEDGKEKKTGKGIKKYVLTKEIKHADFKDCSLEPKEYQHTMMSFRRQQHQLFTIKQTKKSLSPFDDKRYILEDRYTTRAHGHWRNGFHRDVSLPAVEEPMSIDPSVEDIHPPNEEPMEFDPPVEEVVSEPMDIDPPELSEPMGIDCSMEGLRRVNLPEATTEIPPHHQSSPDQSTVI